MRCTARTSDPARSDVPLLDGDGSFQQIRRGPFRPHGLPIPHLRLPLVAVAGFVARGEAREESDVDILVDSSAPVKLSEFLRLQRHLESGKLKAFSESVSRGAGRLCGSAPEGSHKPRARERAAEASTA